VSTFLCAVTLSLFAFSSSHAAASEVSTSENSAPITAMMHFMHDEINPQLTAPLSQQYARAVLADAQTSRVDPCLLLAVVGVESHFKANSISKHGAIGLGQLLPATAQTLHVDPTSPLSNLWGTSQYLRSLLDRFSFERVAIAAYNAGPGAIARNHGDPTSPENAIYVQRVVALWQAAKQRLGTLMTLPLEQTLVATRKAPLSANATIASEQTSWWTSEGTIDPDAATNASLTRRILHL